MKLGLCFALAAVNGCGAGFTEADASAARHAAELELAVEAVIAIDGDDGGSCNGAQVRALERAAYCANASQLYRHRRELPKTTIRCEP